MCVALLQVLRRQKYLSSWIIDPTVIRPKKETRRGVDTLDGCSGKHPAGEWGMFQAEETAGARPCEECPGPVGGTGKKPTERGQESEGRGPWS